MRTYTITIVEDTVNIPKAIPSWNTMDPIAFQYSNRDALLEFVRPVGREPNILRLHFCDKDGNIFNYVDLGTDNEFQVVNSLTQTVQTNIQVSFVSGDFETSYSNIICLRFGPSIPNGVDPIEEIPDSITEIDSRTFQSAEVDSRSSGNFIDFKNRSGEVLQRIWLPGGGGSGGGSVDSVNDVFPDEYGNISMGAEDIPFENDDYNTVQAGLSAALSGSGGTTNYEELSNKPQINDVVLSGNLTIDEIGLVASEENKGLSTNDYTDVEKEKLSTVEEGANKTVQATEINLGGIIASPRTASDTIEVRIDEVTGKLFVPSGGIVSIPQATESELGGIRAKSRTTETNEIAIDDITGKLYAPAQAAGQVAFSSITGNPSDNEALANILEQKVAKIEGMGLSTEDYTSLEKNKLNTIENNATNTIKTSQLVNDSNFAYTTDSRFTDARPASDVFTWAKDEQKPTYNKSEVGLENVDNTADIDKPISIAQMEAISTLDIKIEELTAISPDVGNALKRQGNGLFVNSGEQAFTGAGAHNSIYRGKFIGNEITVSQYAAIESGTFDDLYVGDYWEINNITWRIAAFNYFYNQGDQVDHVNINKNHAVIMPDQQLRANVTMNNTNTTTTGYVNSKIRTVDLPEILTLIESLFGSEHLMEHRDYFSNASNNGKISGANWYDSIIELPSNRMLVGWSGFPQDPATAGAATAIYNLGNIQLPLFSLHPCMLNISRSTFWIRDLFSATEFCAISGYGALTKYVSTYNISGVRPYFCIMA